MVERQMVGELLLATLGREMVGALLVLRWNVRW